MEMKKLIIFIFFIISLVAFCGNSNAQSVKSLVLGDSIFTAPESLSGGNQYAYVCLLDSSDGITHTILIQVQRATGDWVGAGLINTSTNAVISAGLVSVVDGSGITYEIIEKYPRKIRVIKTASSGYTVLRQKVTVEIKEVGF